MKVPSVEAKVGKSSVGFKQNNEQDIFESAGTTKIRSVTVTLLLRVSMNFYPNIPHFLHDLGQFQMKDLNVADNQV
jgi:hypothetical protein